MGPVCDLNVFVHNAIEETAASTYLPSYCHGLGLIFWEVIFAFSLRPSVITCIQKQ